MDESDAQLRDDLSISRWNGETVGESPTPRRLQVAANNRPRRPHLIRSTNAGSSRIFDLRSLRTGKSILGACLGGVNSDLFDLELNLGEHLRRTIAADAVPIEDSEQQSRSVDLLLRVIKHIPKSPSLRGGLRKDGEEAAAAFVVGPEAKETQTCAPTDDPDGSFKK